MRRAECVGMTVDDVDLDQRIVWVLGKGRRPQALPIGRKTAQALDRYLRVGSEKGIDWPTAAALGRPQRTHDSFGHLPGRPPSSPGCRAAEMHPHQLRHAFAITWLAEGGNENELMLVARWKSRTMIDHHTKATAVEHARASHARLSSADRIWAHVGPVCPAVRTHMTQDRAEVTGGPRPKATESTSSSEDTIRLRGQAVGCLIGRLVAT
jgi:integrase/recombinase XerC